MNDSTTQRTGEYFHVTYSIAMWDHKIPEDLEAFVTYGAFITLS